MGTDTRVQRTWFLQGEGNSKDWPADSLQPSKHYAAIQKESKRISEEYHTVVRIILAHKPLTFGHSQLIVTFTGSAARFKEAEQFDKAARAIKASINVFEQVFGVLKVHQRKRFATLSQVTRTKGIYRKTLILRASAEEKRQRDLNEYKVHLVPYFASHSLNCQLYFQAIHSQESKERGALLAWLGKREEEVDGWAMPPHPWVGKLDKIACANWKMAALAELLCETLAKQKNV